MCILKIKVRTGSDWCRPKEGIRILSCSNKLSKGVSSLVTLGNINAVEQLMPSQISQSYPGITLDKNKANGSFPLLFFRIPKNDQYAQSVFYQLNQAFPLGGQYITCPKPSFFSNIAALGIGFDKLVLTKVSMTDAISLVFSKCSILQQGCIYLMQKNMALRQSFRHGW